jgi:glycine dehydrogenase
MSNEFLDRHIGPNEADIASMLSAIGQKSVDDVVSKTVPSDILLSWTSATTNSIPSGLARVCKIVIVCGWIIDLTGLDISNAALLDEPTAAAEAMMMAHRANRKNKSNKFLCDSNTHPQTITILQTRAKPLGIELVVADGHHHRFSSSSWLI